MGYATQDECRKMRPCNSNFTRLHAYTKVEDAMGCESHNELLNEKFLKHGKLVEKFSVAESMVPLELQNVLQI